MTIVTNSAGLDRRCTNQECAEMAHQMKMHAASALYNGDPFQSYRMFWFVMLWAAAAGDADETRKAGEARKMLWQNYKGNFPLP